MQFRRHFFAFCLITALIFIAVSGLKARSRQVAEDVQRSIQVGSETRMYYLHVPEALPKGKPVALVLVFHGGGGTARRLSVFTGFDRVADEEGFVVVYPESVNKSWDDTRGLSPGNDIGFVRALISELKHSFPIDPERVYATGISNGGFFSTRLACELSDQVAAIAAVAATMPETLINVCKPSRPVSVMFMHGNKDPIVHIDGGPILRDRGSAVSLKQAIEFWRTGDQTSPTPTVQSWPDEAKDGTTVHREIYTGGKQETEVVVYTIEGGGHTWPDGPQYLPVFIVGKASKNLDATQVIWEFFKSHPQR